MAVLYTYVELRHEAGELCARFKRSGNDKHTLSVSWAAIDREFPYLTSVFGPVSAGLCRQAMLRLLSISDFPDQTYNTREQVHEILKGYIAHQTQLAVA